jgi:DNA-binding NarL/FixJ family response regulator
VTVQVLTEIEKQVARLAADGCADVEIADQLDLPPAIVAAHLSSVFRKLGAQDRADLAKRLTGAP